MVLFAGFFAWGVALVVIDFVAKRRLRRETEQRRDPDPAKVADEAEW